MIAPTKYIAADVYQTRDQVSIEDSLFVVTNAHLLRLTYMLSGTICDHVPSTVKAPTISGARKPGIFAIILVIPNKRPV